MTTTNDTTRGINPRSPRFGAAITTVLLATTIILTLVATTWIAGIVLLAVIVVFFAIGGTGIRRHPYGALFRNFVRPSLAPPAEIEAPEPPTFAQQVGLVISALALVLAPVASPTPHPSAP